MYKLNKWYLAILAYNSGEGNVAEGIARSALDRYLEFNPHMEDNQTIRNYKKMGYKGKFIIPLPKIFIKK